MTDELEKLVPAEGRPAYEAPRALRLGNGQGGLGQNPPCTSPGSSAADCTTGSQAAAYCTQQGSSADLGCSYDGSAADFGECLADGVSAATDQCVDSGSDATSG
jgi:hypothetical protein